MISSTTTEEQCIELTADQQAVLKRTLSEIAFTCKHMSDLTTKNQLSVELARTMLFLSEHHIRDIGKTLGVATESQAAIEERYSLLRTANLRVRELEKELGAKLGGEALKAGIQSLGERIQSAWRKDGLGHVSQFKFGDWGSCKVTLSCTVSGHFSLMNSDTPVSDKARRIAWHTALSDSGFVLLGDDPGRENIVDCDSSRTALRALIAKLWPSAELVEIRSHATGKSRTLTLREAEIYIRSYDDILAHEVLPDA